MGIEPSPSNIGDKLAWPRARAVSDPLSHRPPMIKHHQDSAVVGWYNVHKPDSHWVYVWVAHLSQESHISQ